MSPEQRTTELIHLAVDGEATEHDLEELDDLLGKSAEARIIRDEIEDLVRQLNGFPPAEPPQLKQAILEQIRSRSTPSNVVPIHSRRRRVFAIAAWAVAASIVVGFGIEKYLDQRAQSVSRSQASASMTPLTVEEWPEVARITRGNAKMTIRRSGDLYAVQPTVSTPAPIAISWDAGRFVLDEASPAPEAARDAAEVRFAAGKKQVTIILRRRPDAFGSTDVHLSVSGSEVATAPVSLD
ncbi:MAG: hypothetical protein ACXVJT_04555 [Thermoanaerobaculia bacterium]